MATAPGKKYAGSPIRIGFHFEEDDGDDVDPTTVTFKVRSPTGVETSYVYGTDSAVVKLSTGDYYGEFTPTEGGVWRWRFQTTGQNVSTAMEGREIVQASEFDGFTDTTYDYGYQ